MNQYSINDLTGDMFLLHGPPGTGKTYMASTFGKNYRAFDIERGGKYLYEQGKRVLCRNLEEFHRQKDLAVKMAGIDTIIIDTLGRLCLWIDQDICGRHGVHGLGAVPHGAGWGEYTNAVAKLLSDLRASGKTTVLICHTKYVEDKVKTVGLSSTIGMYSMGEADHIGYCWKTLSQGEPSFRVSFGGSDTIHAKSRHPILNGAVNLENRWGAVVEYFEQYKMREEGQSKGWSEAFISLLRWAKKQFGHQEDDFVLYLDSLGHKTEEGMIAYGKKLYWATQGKADDVDLNKFTMEYYAWVAANRT